MVHSERKEIVYEIILLVVQRKKGYFNQLISPLKLSSICVQVDMGYGCLSLLFFMYLIVKHKLWTKESKNLRRVHPIKKRNVHRTHDNRYPDCLLYATCSKQIQSKTNKGGCIWNQGGVFGLHKWKLSCIFPIYKTHFLCVICFLTECILTFL